MKCAQKNVKLVVEGFDVNFEYPTWAVLSSSETSLPLKKIHLTAFWSSDLMSLMSSGRMCTTWKTSKEFPKISNPANCGLCPWLEFPASAIGAWFCLVLFCGAVWGCADTLTLGSPPVCWLGSRMWWLLHGKNRSKAEKMLVDVGRKLRIWAVGRFPECICSRAVERVWVDVVGNVTVVTRGGWFGPPPITPNAPISPKWTFIVNSETNLFLFFSRNHHQKTFFFFNFIISIVRYENEKMCFQEYFKIQIINHQSRGFCIWRKSKITTTMLLSYYQK